jgi:hypothetical protein
LRESTGPIATRVREFVDEKYAEVKAAWDEVPQREQVRLGMAGLGGLFVGLCVGLLMPRKSAAACTAFLGAAIWLPALGWVLHALEAPGRNMLDQKGLVWLIVWICLSCLGLAVQVMGSRSRRKASEAA